MKMILKTIIMFNRAAFRASWHHKRKIRKKNYHRIQYMIIRINNLPKDFFINKEKYINK